MTPAELMSKKLVYHQTAQRLSEAMKIIAYDGTVSMAIKMNMMADISKAMPAFRRLMVIVHTEEINAKPTQ